MFEIERTRLDRWRGWASWRQAVYRQISGNPSVFSALGASLSGLRQSAREIQIFIYESQFSVEKSKFLSGFRIAYRKCENQCKQNFHDSIGKFCQLLLILLRPRRHLSSPV